MSSHNLIGRCVTAHAKINGSTVLKLLFVYQLSTINLTPDIKICRYNCLLVLIKHYYFYFATVSKFWSPKDLDVQP